MNDFIEIPVYSMKKGRPYKLIVRKSEILCFDEIEKILSVHAGGIESYYGIRSYVVRNADIEYIKSLLLEKDE